MEEKPNYYAVLPAPIRYDKRLSDKAKLLWAEISALCNKTGACWATNKYFAELYGISTRSVTTLINQLIKCEYLTSSIYYLKGTKAIDKRVLKIISIPIEENFYTPIEENFQENNTSINNTSNKKEIYKERKHYGEYNNVFLTDEELEKLKAEFKDWEARIERVSSYCASTGKTYKNYLATIRNWAQKDKSKEESTPVYDASKNRQMSDEEMEELLNLRYGRNT